MSTVHNRKAEFAVYDANLNIQNPLRGGLDPPHPPPPPPKEKKRKDYSVGNVCFSNDSS